MMRILVHIIRANARRGCELVEMYLFSHKLYAKMLKLRESTKSGRINLSPFTLVHWNNLIEKVHVF
jgi:hypothetical protein